MSSEVVLYLKEGYDGAGQKSTPAASDAPLSPSHALLARAAALYMGRTPEEFGPPALSARGKPYFPDCPALFFSISHSGTLWACAMAAAGFAIPWAFLGLYGLRMLEGGYLLVLTPLVAAFCSDALALFTGMALGRHKLAPLVSPHKTVEGAAGGLVGGMSGMAIFCLVYRAITGVNLGLPLCVALGLLGALLGELGDLSFSAVKRQYGIKDYGRLLPGHGGVLDRFDSVLFAAPVLYALLRALAA